VVYWFSVLEGSRHQLCGSLSHGVMPGPAAAMQSFSAAAAAGSHHHSQVPSQYHVTLPAHQPPVRHNHSMVDSAYASVPGMLDIFFLFSARILPFPRFPGEPGYMFPPRFSCCTLQYGDDVMVRRWHR